MISKSIWQEGKKAIQKLTYHLVMILVNSSLHPMSGSETKRSFEVIKKKLELILFKQRDALLVTLFGTRREPLDLGDTPRCWRCSLVTEPNMGYEECKCTGWNPWFALTTFAQHLNRVIEFQCFLCSGKSSDLSETVR